MCWLLVLQVAGARVGTACQQEAHQGGARAGTRQCRCHVQCRVPVGLCRVGGPKVRCLLWHPPPPQPPGALHSV